MAGGGAATLEEDGLPATNFCLLSISAILSYKLGLFHLKDLDTS